MSDSEKSLSVKMQKGAVKAVVGAVASALAYVVTGGNAEATLAAGALAPALEGFADEVRNRRVNRHAIWWQKVLDDPTRSQEQVAAELLDATANPDTVEVVMRSVRDLADVVDEVVVPALGLLAREYLRDRKRPDPFYRSTVRVLSDCTTEDFEDLKTILRAASATVDLYTGRSVLIQQDGNTITFQAAGLPLPTKQLEGDAGRILHLLTVNSLATSEFQPSAYDVGDGPSTRIQVEVVRRLADILAVSEAHLSQEPSP